MKYFISKDEMRLLAYLHENATGYNDDHMFEANPLAEALGITDEQLLKDTSFLHSFGLVGVLSTSSFDGPSIGALWLTGLGENMMREIESQPSVPTKVTRKVIEEGWDTLKQIIVQVAGGYMSGGGR